MSVSDWFLRPVERPNASVVLVMLHHVGGAAAVYSAWAKALPPTIEPWLVELPGHGARRGEPRIDRFAAMIDGLAAGLRPATERRFALFGHSMGALLSFELTRRFIQDGTPLPTHLFLNGFKEPGNYVRNRVRRSRLSDPQLLEYIVSLGGTPPEILEQKELLDMTLPLIRADYSVLDDYEPPEAVKLPCPITVLGGTSDKSVPFASLADWEKHAGQGFKLVPMPGGHFFLHDQKAKVIQQLVADLQLPPVA